jgi:hypothetical protein
VGTLVSCAKTARLAVDGTPRVVCLPVVEQLVELFADELGEGA